MLANFYGAIYGWTICIVTTSLISVFTERKFRKDLMEITYFTQSPTSKGVPLVSWLLAASVLVACIVLNFMFQ